MKTTLKLITLLAAVLMFGACEKDKTHERDIVYAVDAQRYEVHLKTEAEFDALLEQFCDYAENGSLVTFSNSAVGFSSKGEGRKDAITYSTTDREAMKSWMAKMEDEGKTVTVTYDSTTGTYSGTAYANAPQPPQPSGMLLTYECDGMNDFGYIMSFDTVNRRVYITLHDNRYYPQGLQAPDYPVGMYEYRHAEEVNTPFAYWFIDNWGDTAGLYILKFSGDTLHYNTNPLGYPATLVRTDQWQTYLAFDDISRAAIVMHINTNVIETNPMQFIGQANSNYDGGQAYGPGRFVMQRMHTIDYGGILLYYMILDFSSFNNDVVYIDFLIQNEPIVDDHFIISHGLYHDNYAPHGIGITSQDLFYRLGPQA